MAIVNIRWDISGDNDYGGYDVHVVRNNKWSGDIRRALLMDSSANGTNKSLDLFMGSVITDPGFVSATITPSYSGGKSAKYNPTTKIYSLDNTPTGSLDYKVQFDSVNCKIKADVMTAFLKINFLCYKSKPLRL